MFNNRNVRCRTTREEIEITKWETINKMRWVSQHQDIQITAIGNKHVKNSHHYSQRIKDRYADVACATINKGAHKKKNFQSFHQVKTLLQQHTNHMEHPHPPECAKYAMVHYEQWNSEAQAMNYII